ncbi:hypothetical protein CEXT_361041 [Caerostris extrusa]|uniref:Uncharacterized protein n=1 Tax=Caerostris extrusa TaxID=172846 RepID=A0AAV4PLE9_CAEEX|nr:hypothetical protein CEXT_361041 [Caerostris extrusa]
MIPGDKTKCTLLGERARHFRIFVSPQFGIRRMVFLLYWLHSWNSGNLLCLLANSVVPRPGYSGDEWIMFFPPLCRAECFIQL